MARDQLRSDILQLNQIIWNVVRQSQIGPEEFEIVDLSKFETFEEQINHMRILPQADGDE